MKTRDKATMGRRDFLRTLGAGASVAAVTAALPAEAQATESPAEERKARYQANSPDIQSYYRVNRYPKR